MYEAMYRHDILMKDDFCKLNVFFVYYIFCGMGGYVFLHIGKLRNKEKTRRANIL